MTFHLIRIALAAVASTHHAVTGPPFGFNAAAFFFALATIAAARRTRRRRRPLL